MLNIDVLEDEEIQGVIKRFISSVLPHENYDANCFSVNLSTIFKYVRLEEFKLDYRLLLEALSDLNKIKSSFDDFEPKFTLENFETLLEISIGEAVTREELGVKEWLLYEGLDANLSNEMSKETACQKLFQKCTELYEECFDLAEDSISVCNREPELRAAFVAAIGLQTVNTQVKIIRDGIRIGRRYYSGFEDWREYLNTVSAELSSRLSNASEENVIILDDLEKSTKLLSKLSNFNEPIAEWGIPELDNFTPMLKHRLVVVVGAENIGKTKFCVDKAVNALLQSKKVAYMCGESQLEKVLGDVIVNYVWKRFGYVIRPEHIAKRDECPEDIRKVIGIAIDEIVTKGKLTLVTSFSYNTLYQEMQDLHERCNFDLLVIDHSCALKGRVGMGLKDNVDELALQTREFKKNNPVCILISSHPSVTARESMSRGREISDSPTKGSQGLSAEADEIFVLRDNETLAKQGLLECEVYKRRDADEITDRIILRKKFEVSALIYDESFQAVNEMVSLEKQEAIDALIADSEEAMYTL